MNRPRILITASYSEKGFINMNPSYFNAVWQAGGMPCFAAYTQEKERLMQYAEEFDGFIFSGGVDIDPKYYGETKQFDSVEICKARDEFELSLAELVLKTEKPVLGICRGIQLLNVAMGGTLYQHIENHRQNEKGNVPTQNVTLKKNSLLYKIAENSEKIKVNSFHHQAIKNVAKNAECAAVSDDGYCEAICTNDRKFLLGVQWHPELLYKNDRTSANIFSCFVNASK